MRILVASDSFKDGCSSIEACQSIAEGILLAHPEAHIHICPISDGGEGTVEILQYHLRGQLIKVEVSNPLFKKVQAKYLYMNGTAFIEMAQASGLELLSQSERNPMNTSTFGTGELIEDGLDRGCSEIIISVGGSVTNDLGIGMASALGARFVDASGNDVAPIGYNMFNVVKVDLSGIDARVVKTRLTVITDVNNPLYGPKGAAYVFGRQKGGDDQTIPHLDSGLQHLWKIIGTDVIPDTPGFGAAGGLAAGCVAFLDAEIQAGFSKIAELIQLSQKVDQADIIITGEGHLDSQTADGKLISGIAGLAEGKKVIVFCGKNSLAEEDAKMLNISKVIPISPVDQHLEIALSKTKENLKRSARLWATADL